MRTLLILAGLSVAAVAGGVQLRATLSASTVRVQGLDVVRILVGVELSELTGRTLGQDKRGPRRYSSTCAGAVSALTLA